MMADRQAGPARRGGDAKASRASTPGFVDPARGPSGPPMFPAAAVRVEAVGRLCPIPITRTARAVRALAEGEVLELRADDRVVLIDLPNWCRSWRHDYLGHFEQAGILHLFVRKQGRGA